MKFETLYGKDSKGNLRVWTIKTEGNSVTVEHGREDGKLTSKTYYTKGKNLGRSNETTPDQQAILEAEARHTIQQKHGYFLTKEELKHTCEYEPMKCQDYKDFAKKVKYPVLISPKLDGFRLMIDGKGRCVSKQGEDYVLPPHLECLREIAIHFGGLDGEIYAGLPSDGGLSLQEIISAFRKPNENTHKLQFYIYDVPDIGAGAEARQKTLEDISHVISQDRPVQVVLSTRATSEEHADALYNRYINLGFEGVVYRNTGGMYEMGKRSYDMLKRKPRYSAEALVTGVEKDKSGQGVLYCQSINGGQTGNLFKCLMKKEADSEVNYRLFENACTLVGKHVEYEFESLSDDMIPLKPVAIRIREVMNGESRY